MKHALIVNIGIILLVGLALWITREAASLAFLFLLVDMPYGLLAQGRDEEDEDEPQPMGFTQKLNR